MFLRQQRIMIGLESSKTKFPHLLNNNNDVKMKGFVKTLYDLGRHSLKPWGSN